MNREKILELEQRIGTNDTIIFLKMMDPADFEGDIDALISELEERLPTEDTTAEG
jgi:hypothetical protein